MTETGFASAARGRNGSAALFSPVGCASIPREAKKRGAAVLQQAYGPSAAAAAAPVMSQAIEAVMVRSRKRKGNYHGYHRHLQEDRQRRICRRIVTLSVQAKGVRIVPDEYPRQREAPSHRSSSAAPRSAPPGPSSPTRAAPISGSSSTIRASPPRSTPTFRRRGRQDLQPDLVAPEPPRQRLNRRDTIPPGMSGRDLPLFSNG